MAKTQILHVAVDKITERMLRQEAKKQDVSLSDVLRFAINSYLAATAATAPNPQKEQAA